MWIFAHRGAAANQRLENTADAFATALQRGAQLESDARLSRDGDVVLIHDAYTGRRPLLRAVRSQRTSRLRRKGALTITDFYEQLGTDFELSVDLKDSGAGTGLIAAAEQVEAVQRLWLVSDQLSVLQRLRATNAEVRLVHEARRREIGNAAAHAERLAAAGIDAQNTDTTGWDPDLVENAHSRGLLAFGSLANDGARLRRAAELGLDAIYTDRLQLAEDVLR